MWWKVTRFSMRDVRPTNHSDARAAQDPAHNVNTPGAHSAVDPARNTASPAARPAVDSAPDPKRSCVCPGSGPARHSLAALLFTLGAVCLLYTIVPDDTFAHNLTLTALLAVIILIAVTLSAPYTLKHLRIAMGRKEALWTVFVGFAGGVALVALAHFASDVIPSGISALSTPALISTPPSFLTSVACVLILCLATGILEEGLFRVLFMNALVEHGPFAKRSWLAAAMLSSAVFALLHVPLSALAGSVGDSGTGNLALIQAFLKLAQTFTFGLIMAGLYAANRNLWSNALMHTFFNLFYLGPIYLGWAVPATYLPGSSDDFAVLIITLVLLIPPAVTLWRKLLQSQR